ncbi:putative beta-1 [Abeliophyllum distichum]|uniref:Hexosyltransferase n=1 Tax=Abeliophyllum distichum TaxID=126358 RepID=A0ABD1TWZ2_9LAMI
MSESIFFLVRMITWRLLRSKQRRQSYSSFMLWITGMLNSMPKVNDDIYVNIDALGAVLSSHLDQPRAYIGCMKSGEVFSQPSHKWYEPDWWKFGDGKSYFRHASGEIFAISQALAQFISINRLFLHMYSHDDVSAGSWFIGLDVKHVDEGKFCCSSWSSGAVCAAA